ncbi:protein FAM219A-like isoform X1 [Ostrea edulis]|uniref:protein FAM219A-like isoform X1 n=1 Tax=Ostrea edulis TaxID=37623 RepID=UPI0020942D8B|nr:protein FAM219A-like isoform X1 [Ostrea edulis]
MENMEDSGFDSDYKSNQTDSLNSPPNGSANGLDTPKTHSNTYKKSYDLQKKIDKHKENAARRAITTQPKRSILSRNRLTIPQKNDIKPMNNDTQPLVTIMTDDSDDEFELPVISKAAQKEITQQLIKDGYNLDLEPDDEDLDLIPPRPVNERCTCCNYYTGYCAIQ